MRRSLLTLFAAACDRSVAAALPGFGLCPAPARAGPGRLYAERSAGPALFVCFQASDKRDAFTVELAWSGGGTFPPPSDYPVPRDWPEIGVRRGDLDVAEFRFRLSKLWVKPKYDPSWEFEPRPGPLSRTAELSVVADPYLSDADKCEQLIGDAVRRIVTLGLPYLRDVRARPEWRGNVREP